MKIVASKLVCGTSMLNIPVRAAMVTGTLIFIHCLVAAKPARDAKVTQMEVRMVPNEMLEIELRF